MGLSAENGPLDLAALHEQDLCARAEANARFFRGRRLSEIDAAHIAEELDDMGKSERRSLRRHLRNLIVHLLKWQHQSERRTTSWELSILDVRNEIEDILTDSPSLAPYVSEYIEAGYAAARKAAAVETKLDVDAFPAISPYAAEQLRDDGSLPNP